MEEESGFWEPAPEAEESCPAVAGVFVAWSGLGKVNDRAEALDLTTWCYSRSARKYLFGIGFLVIGQPETPAVQSPLLAHDIGARMIQCACKTRTNFALMGAGWTNGLTSNSRVMRVTPTDLLSIHQFPPISI